MELLGQALRQVLFILDQVTYGLIPSAYELIFYLSNVNLFDNDILSGVINRVYLLLGIFMLFKVAFSMIRFLIDPNAFSDSSKGFSKLVTNSLVALVLLVTIPFIFEKAYQFQGDIILSNVIPRLVLGDSSYTDFLGNKQFGEGNTKINEDEIIKQQSEIHSMGVDVQFAMFSAFYNLNTSDDINGYTECAPSKEHPISNVLGSSDMLDTCWGSIQQDLTTELHKQGGTLKQIFKYSGDKTDSGEPCPNGICDERTFAGFGNLLWWIKAGGNSPFTINYTPIISAIAGGYLLLLLISFAIDIATRVFKLLFLQTIAPIAIISYMDPSESTSNGKFHKWLVECGKTYGSLFLRLAVIYFAILLIRIITSSVFAATGDSGGIYYNGMRPTDTMNMFVYVFLILGIFTFAKKVPQMIEGIFGIKMSGEMNLNPFKAIKEIGDNGAVKLGLGAAGIAATTASSAIGTGIAAGYKAKSDLDHGVARSSLSALGGAFVGAKRGLLGGIKSKGKFSTDTMGASMGKTMRNMDVRNKTDGWKGAPARVADRARYTIGASSKYERLEAQAAKYDDVVSKVKAADEYVDKQVAKSGAGKDVIAMKNRAAQLEAQGQASEARRISTAAGKLQKKLKEDYYMYNGRTYDSGADKMHFDANGNVTRIDLDPAKVNAKNRDNSDSMLPSYKRTIETVVKEVTFDDSFDIENKSFDNLDDIGDIKKYSELQAIQTRSTKEYDDAKDIHENIQAQAKQGAIKGMRK